MDKTKGPKGLTLIEIVIVMAIISMLAFLAYPAAVNAIKRGEYVNDVSDTRQDNLETFMDTVDEGYDALPEHLKEGRLGDKE